MDEDRLPPARKGEIRSPGKVLTMKPEAITQGVHSSANNHLGFGIARPHSPKPSAGPLGRWTPCHATSMRATHRAGKPATALRYS